ncbi:PfkB family carbohydrate kinase [uncultured Tateyamaria sp.]|uniref:PfkB family carbohydrate kinase n=1 Tax=uncultured Tateyamaria sp. TaxID=455651 RepID=UPI0026140822|nr:PfkB family carbohydrate kinase [uncultured Tateyamaria sp.]
MSVFVAGSLHLDVVLRAPDLPRLDETVTGSAVTYVFGGKGGNQAVAASRMGADVDFAGRIGGDRFGDMIHDALLAAGVNIDQVQVDGGASGMSAAIVNDDGDYGAVIVSAANLRIDPQAIALPDGTKLVLLQNEIPEAVNLAVARQAVQQGVPVWLNAAPARTLSPSLADAVDLLIVNQVEAEFYAGATSDTRMIRTLGADGVSFHGTTYPAHAVNVISTHGAGDMFVGALAAQVAVGTSMTDAIAFAQAAAALHVSKPVYQRNSITPDKVQTFQADQLNW